jgi:DNA-binding NarL/FixJ family response regulator
MFVDGLRALLSREFDIVGVARDGDEAMAMLTERSADCVLLDLVLPKHNGLELIPIIRRLQPHAKVLVVTMLRDRVLAEAALAAGASGFIPKDSGIEELTTAISEVVAGRTFLSRTLPRTSHRVGLEAQRQGLDRLTPRQEAIMLMMGEGKSETEIARELHLSQSTVTFHKHNTMRSLGISDDASLLKFAVLVRHSHTA